MTLRILFYGLTVWRLTGLALLAINLIKTGNFYRAKYS
jgi:hypothetical protein